MSEYRYAQGDLMGSPQTYFYTAFEGRSFLDAWWLCREEALGDLPDPAEELPQPDTDADGTEGLLEQGLAAAGRAQPGNGGLPEPAEMWLRKFEVGKRVNDRYRDDLRPATWDAYRTHRYYVRAGEVFGAALEATGDIRA